MITAVIFDMDGVISDTQKLHSKVESGFFAEHGVKISPEEITGRFAGRRPIEFMKELLPDKSDEEIRQLVERKFERMQEIAKQGVEPIPGAIELIKSLAKSGFKLAVASASPKRYIEAVIESMGLTKYFPIRVSADEVKIGKPDPAVFLEAAKRLKAKPGQCLVIEDGISGMQAAKAAGMKCIGLVERKGNYPCDSQVCSLKDVNSKLFD